MSEAHKAIIRRLFSEVVEQGNLDLLDELVAPDAVDHNAVRYQWASGREGFRRHAGFLREVFPDFAITIDDMIAEGDRVILFWTVTGTHRGEAYGVAGTGRRVSGPTVTIIRFRDGKIVEYESRPDRLTLLLQMGSLGVFAEQLVSNEAPHAV